MSLVRWCVNVDEWKPSETEWTAALKRIANEPNELKRIAGFYFEIDAKRALVGRLLLREFAHRICHIPYDRVRYGRTPFNRPILLNRVVSSVAGSASEPNATAFASATAAATASAAARTDDGGDGGWLVGDGVSSVDVNVSHHGRWVLLVAAPDACVGCDVMSVEVPNASEASAASLCHDLRACFTEREWTIIRSELSSTAVKASASPSADAKTAVTTTTAAPPASVLSPSYRQRAAYTDCTHALAPQTWALLARFMCLWSHKEAFIKCVGVGMGIDLQSLQFDWCNGTARISLAPAPTTVAGGAVACEQILSLSILNAGDAKNQTRNIFLPPPLDAAASDQKSAAASDQKSKPAVTAATPALAWSLADLVPAAHRFRFEFSWLDGGHVATVCTVSRAIFGAESGKLDTSTAKATAGAAATNHPFVTIAVSELMPKQK